MTLCWVWNSLLPDFYHLLVQVRHARSLLFPLGTNDWAKIKPRSKKYPLCFWKSRVILGQKSVFNHSYWCQKGKERLLACLICTKNDNNRLIVSFRPKHWVKWQEMGENCFLKGKNGQFYSIK